jgi:hypothetical protein
VLFYVLQPVYRLLGESTAGMNTGVAVINVAAAVILIAVAARLGGPLLGLWAGVVVGVFLAAIDLDLLRDFWIPHVVVLSVAAFAVLCGGLASGRVWYLPGVAALGCFLCETDLSLSPCVIAMGLGALALFLVSGPRGWRAPGAPAVRGRRLPGWAPYALAAVAMAVLVAPPVYQELFSDSGNLTQLWNFFKTPAPTHPLREALGSAATALSVLPRGSQVFDDGVRADAASNAVFVGEVVLLGAGAVLAWRRNNRFAAALCAVALIGIAGAVVGVTRIRGPIYPYLVFWLSSLGIVAWLAIGAAIGPELGTLLGRVIRRPLGPLVAAALALALVAVTVVNVAAVAREPSVTSVRSYSDPRVKSLTAAADRWMSARGIRKPTVFIPHPERWPDAAGIVLQLHRAGRPVSVESPWLYMFGKRFAPDGDEDGSLIFTTTSAGPAGVVLTKAHRRIATYGDVTLYGGDVAGANAQR